MKTLSHYTCLTCCCCCCVWWAWRHTARVPAVRPDSVILHNARRWRSDAPVRKGWTDRQTAGQPESGRRQRRGRHRRLCSGGRTRPVIEYVFYFRHRPPLCTGCRRSIWQACETRRSAGLPAGQLAGRSAGPTTGRKLAGRNPIYPVEISVSGNTTTAACSMSTGRRIHGIMERTHGVRRGETLVISVVHVTDRFRYYGHRRWRRPFAAICVIMSMMMMLVVVMVMTMTKKIVIITIRVRVDWVLWVVGWWAFAHFSDSPAPRPSARIGQIFGPYGADVTVMPSVVVLEESPCPHGSSMTNFQVLSLSSSSEVQVIENFRGLSRLT